MLARLVGLMGWWVAASAAAAAASAADFRIVSATQPSAGQLVVQMATGLSRSFTAADFTLEFPGGAQFPAAALKDIASVQESRSLLLCIDTSGSMGAAVPEIKNVLAFVLAGPNRPDALPYRASLTAFDTRAQRLLPFSSDKRAVATAVQQLQVDPNPSGQTRLYDAVHGAVDDMRTESQSARHIIVVSDGKDEHSTIDANRLRQVILRESPAIVVDAIAFGPESIGYADSLRAMVVAGSRGQFIDAGTDSKLLAQALESLTKLAVVPRLLELSFSYPPAQGVVATAETGAKVNAGGDSMEVPVPVVPAGSGSVADDSDTQKTRPGLSLWPWLAALAAAIVLGLLLYLLLRKPPERELHANESNGHDDSPPTQPPPSPAVPIPAPTPVPGVTMVAHRWPLPGNGIVAQLHGLSGDALDKQYPIDKADVSVGAALGNDIVFSRDEFVSGQHAVFKAAAHSLYIVDLSRNGTFVNGRMFKNTTQALFPGDVLQFGRTAVEVVASGHGPRRSADDFEPIVP